MKGTLWLIPNVLDDGDPSLVLSPSVIDRIGQIRYFIVENEKTARRFLVHAGFKHLLEELEWGLLNEHTRESELTPLLEPLLNGIDAGILSESGCPGIADPGAPLIRLAHQADIKVKPLSGPSSVILALMSSGLTGQRFTFHGYLPVKPSERIRKIRDIEQKSKFNNESQIFIEAPYRNRQLFEDLVRNLAPDTWLSIAVELTSSNEMIKTTQIWDWSRKTPDLNKRPAVFILSAK